MAIKDDLLFVADFSGLFHCLDAKTGLPGMSGEELARRFKGLNPSMPIVFATGHAHPPEGTSDLAAYMLRKPYDLAEIERAISWAIAGQQAA